jgi:nicotinamide phosphoribosyltransferase
LKNNILKTDSYKFSHYLQYPPGTEYVSSYIEPRGVSNDFPLVNEVVNVGLQAFVKYFLSNPIHKNHIDEAEQYAAIHGVPFNRVGWEHILNEHGGLFPLKVQGLPEGTVFPLSTPQVQVVNTDPKVPWLTSYIETALLRAIWYPSTIATLSRTIKQSMKHWVDMTCDNPEAIEGMLQFMLHDFGARGVSSGESAAIGGMAHMLSFRGSDTIEAIKYVNDYYRPLSASLIMPAYSIPAAEHSTITSWASAGGEPAAFLNMIDTFGGPDKIYAVVSDSYDIFHACENLWGTSLKQRVLDKGGRVVIRPDSGDPEIVVLRVLDILSDKFGFSINGKGYKVLHPSVRVIQGDGVNPKSIGRILQKMQQFGYAAENLVFGMGGALLQKVNRDSLKYAMKASAICIDGKWHSVYKDPITDTGKRSKRGVLGVDSDFSVYDVNEEVRKKDYYKRSNKLKAYYDRGQDGLGVFTEHFDTIRERAKL